MLCYVLLLLYTSLNSVVVFNYKELNLPLYVKGWSGGVLSLKVPHGKVRIPIGMGFT